MTLRVTVEDLEQGDVRVREVGEGDYMLVCHEPCYLDTAQSARGGRVHVLTVKGRRVDAARKPEAVRA